MKLIDTKTKEELHVGDIVETVRGSRVQLMSYKEPEHRGSTGRVFVQHPPEDHEREYFPGVIGARFTN